MKIIVNSSQARKLIQESKGGDLDLNVQKLYNLTKKILESAGKQIGENLTFLVTWGASIGGMIGPLNDFIEKKYTGLNEMEVSLLLTGIIANYYFDNKKLISKIVKKIHKGGLSPVFAEIFNKAEELKKTFFKFIESLNITFHKMTNIMSYAFIIPLIPLIYSSVRSGNITNDQILEISERLIAFGLISLSGNAIKQLISKLIRRFMSK